MLRKFCNRQRVEVCALLRLICVCVVRGEGSQGLSVHGHSTLSSPSSFQASALTHSLHLCGPSYRPLHRPVTHTHTHTHTFQFIRLLPDVLAACVLHATVAFNSIHILCIAIFTIHIVSKQLYRKCT